MPMLCALGLGQKASGDVKNKWRKRRTFAAAPPTKYLLALFLFALICFCRVFGLLNKESSKIWKQQKLSGLIENKMFFFLPVLRNA
jgi:uncharacterized BrkB/YihY/UPF0761 family membrane protein